MELARKEVEKELPTSRSQMSIVEIQAEPDEVLSDEEDDEDEDVSELESTLIRQSTKK